MINTLHLVWNLIRGGTEGQCARTAIELAGRGYNQRVMVFRREGYFLEPVERICGPVSEIGIRSMASPRTLAAVVRLARLIKKEDIRILHAWDADAAIFGQFAAALSGARLITSRRDLGEIYPRYKLLLMKRADRRAERIVANARAVVDAFASGSVPADKFEVIPNILDIGEFDRLAAEPSSRLAGIPGGPRVVMVARLDPEKDVATFLYAAEAVLNAHPGVTCVIAGDGSERQELEAMARKHNLDERVKFVGDIPDIPSLLKGSRLGVLTPSRNEGLSNTILEYMAAELPVVATDCGGNRELVDPPSGGAVVDVADFAAAAREILGYVRDVDAARTAGRRNRDRILRDFQPGPVADRFEKLYWSVVRK